MLACDIKTLARRVMRYTFSIADVYSVTKMANLSLQRKGTVGSSDCCCYKRLTCSGVIDGGGQGVEAPPPGKLNVKIGPLLVDILIFSIL